jgi:hypothetical protein
MSTRQQILIAVASGCNSPSQVAEFTGLSYGVIIAHFAPPDEFINGVLLSWQPWVINSLCLGPSAAVTRDRGRVVAVGRAERVD